MLEHVHHLSLQRDTDDESSPRVLDDIAELDDVIHTLTADNVEEVLKVIGTGTEDKENVQQPEEQPDKR